MLQDFKHLRFITHGSFFIKFSPNPKTISAISRYSIISYVIEQPQFHKDEQLGLVALSIIYTITQVSRHNFFLFAFFAHFQALFEPKSSKLAPSLFMKVVLQVNFLMPLEPPKLDLYSTRYQKNSDERLDLTALEIGQSLNLVLSFSPRRLENQKKCSNNKVGDLLFFFLKES